MGPPDMSNLSRSAAQKLLVRRDGARCPSSLSRPHSPPLSVSRSPHRTFGARSQLARPLRQPRPRAGRSGRGDGAAVASDDHLHVGQLRGAVASTHHASADARALLLCRPVRSARRYSIWREFCCKILLSSEYCNSLNITTKSVSSHCVIEGSRPPCGVDPIDKDNDEQTTHCTTRNATSPKEQPKSDKREKSK